MIRVLSLGAGVQSSRLLLGAVEGEFGDAPECAIFADPGWESLATYLWLRTLAAVEYEQVAGSDPPRFRAVPGTYCGGLANLPVHVVTRGEDARGHGSIRDSYYNAQSTGKRYVSLPVFVRYSDGSKGMARRQCTKEFKIEPIVGKVRDLVGLQPRQPGPRHAIAEQWMGISLDEAVRMKDSRIRWIRNRYPLVDHRETRHDCVRWLARRGLRAPKSACIGCPYTNDARWREMKENSPAEFADAVAFDHLIRNGRRTRGQNFLHRSCVPLDEVDFSTAEERGQGNLFSEECEGLCGV